MNTTQIQSIKVFEAEIDESMNLAQTRKILKTLTNVEIENVKKSGMIQYFFIERIVGQTKDNYDIEFREDILWQIERKTESIPYENPIKVQQQKEYEMKVAAQIRYREEN